MIGYKETEGYEYNPEKAKELIATSGYNGEEITFMVSNSVHSRAAEIAQAIQSWAQEVGLNLKVEMLEQATASEKRRSGNYQIGIAGSPQRNGDAFNMYTQDFSRTDQFHTGYVNEELFEKLDDISQTVNIEERSEKLKDALQIVMDEYVFIFLFQAEEAIAMKPEITGLQLYTDGVHDNRYLQKIVS